jgi:hypothetical protein
VVGGEMTQTLYAHMNKTSKKNQGIVDSGQINAPEGTKENRM